MSFGVRTGSTTGLGTHTVGGESELTSGRTNQRRQYPPRSSPRGLVRRVGHLRLLICWSQHFLPMTAPPREHHPGLDRAPRGAAGLSFTRGTWSRCPVCLTGSSDYHCHLLGIEGRIDKVKQLGQAVP